jgi:hypothetical protein
MMDEFIDALRAGFRTDIAIGYGPASFSVNVTDATGPTAITGANQGGSLAFAVDQTRMTYKGGAKAVDLSIASPQIPFPEARLAYAESLIDLVFPIGAAPAPQDFNVTVRLTDLSVSDEIWSMIDPAASIPRDPASLALDAKAKAVLKADLMDEAAVAAAGMPAEMQSLDVPEMLLRFGGAEFTGNGALTFDNSDLATYGGIPAPTGKFDFKLVGGNALLDALIALGLVPEDQAMGIRMGMGMFARPGDGPDTLVSTIEFKDGGLFANGMQLQ